MIDKKWNSTIFWTIITVLTHFFVYNKTILKGLFTCKYFLLSYYLWTIMGLLITILFMNILSNISVNKNEKGIVTDFTKIGKKIYSSPFRWLIILFPLFLIFYLSFKGYNTPTPALTKKAIFMYYLFTSSMGSSLASIDFVYTKDSLRKVFLITLSLVICITVIIWLKPDMLFIFNLGSILITGLIGIIIASFINIFMHSGLFNYIISIVGALIFLGLLAYDSKKTFLHNELCIDYCKKVTNKQFLDYIDDSLIKNIKAERISFLVKKLKEKNYTRPNVLGPVYSLYLDIINLFLMLLRLIGGRD